MRVVVNPSRASAAISEALEAAQKAKEGLLGNISLAVLVAENGARERVLALEFEPIRRSWRVYNGPFLRWVKRALKPPLARGAMASAAKPVILSKP